jgi:hypothetical protein
METNDRKKQREKQAPIIDGDARPDINLNPEDKPKKDIKQVEEKGKTTHNRADRNSLENFKDGK